MISIESFVFNPFMENTYVVYDESGEALIIDPGCYEKSEKEKLVEFISSNGLSVKYIVNTHCHIDHVFGNYYCKEHFKVPLIIHQKDLETLRAVKVYAPSYGFVNFEESEPDQFIEEGEIIQFGTSELEVIFVPGHAPGHIALVNKDQKICLGGDVLFNRSIGRTDLPGGDLDILLNSISEKMFTLPDDTVVYCGHGETTTIQEEKMYNPFCKVK
ncbi:MAG: MBL fold metallo-hydrolase [Cyclobacteriaceae bacterium]|nr:MBL fold metallo-hydrolase [Cyclobacteriaceae bacterium]